MLVNFRCYTLPREMKETNRSWLQLIPFQYPTIDPTTTSAKSDFGFESSPEFFYLDARILTKEQPEFSVNFCKFLKYRFDKHTECCCRSARINTWKWRRKFPRHLDMQTTFLAIGHWQMHFWLCFCRVQFSNRISGLLLAYSWKHKFAAIRQCMCTTIMPSSYSTLSVYNMDAFHCLRYGIKS